MTKRSCEFEKTFYEETMKWLKAPRTRDKKAHDRFDALSREHGPVVFQVVFDIIANLKLSPEEAQKLWGEVWEFKAKMEESLKDRIDFRAALLEYLLGINRKLKSPKIIELSLFEKTQNALIIDELTGLYNFRFLENQLKYETAKSRRFGSQFSIIQMDLDQFKAINETYDHELGDRVLSGVAQTLSRNVRATDMVFRLNGDEFVAFLQNTGKKDALAVAEALRNQVEKDYNSYENKKLGLTLSAGIASFPSDADNPETLLQNARKALLFSKGNGKNRISLYSNHLRTFKRVHLKKKILLEAFSYDLKQAALVDLSKTGISFRTKTAYEPGSYCQVYLETGSSEPLLIRIVRVIEQKGFYLTGGMFLDLNETRLKILKKFIAV